MVQLILLERLKFLTHTSKTGFGKQHKVFTVSVKQEIYVKLSHTAEGLINLQTSSFYRIFALAFVSKNWFRLLQSTFAAQVYDEPNLRRLSEE